MTEHFVRRPGDDVAIAAEILNPDDCKTSEDNAAYIAAANPATVLALLDETEAAHTARREAQARVAELPWLRYVPVISNALPEDGWTGRTGFVHQAVLDDFADLSGHQVYACGAPIVVESARDAYSAQRGLPPEEFFADAFTSEADKHGG